MSLDIYLLYLTVCAVFFATPPGPSQILMISHSAMYGWRRSLPTIAGDLSANALQMTVAAFGLASILASSAIALSVVKWLGVAYLLWMAFRTFTAPPPKLAAESGKDLRGMLARRAFLTSAANPKAVFFFAALFPQFISAGQPIWPQLLILGCTYLVIDGVILVLYGYLAERSAAKLRRLISSRLNQISGLMMAAAAILLALRDGDAGKAR